MDLMSIAMAKMMDDRRDLLRYPDGPLAPARPLIPVVTGFDDQVPINLANITDGDSETCANEGIKNSGGSANNNLGTFYFDLGSVQHVLISLKADMWTSAGSIQAFVDVTNADPTVAGNWPLSGNTITSTANTGSPTIKNSENCAVVIGRYIRVRFGNTAASTIHVKPYSIKATNLGKG